MKKILLLFLALLVLTFGIFLVACDEETYYTVTFDSDGGSEVDSQSVENGKKATEPTAPTKDGYTFAGWYLDDEKWSFIGYSITEEILFEKRKI